MRASSWKQRIGRGVRGFTLIELLVVIAIIAILIGLLLPAVQRFAKRRDATSARTISSRSGWRCTPRAAALRRAESTLSAVMPSLREQDPQVDPLLRSLTDGRSAGFSLAGSTAAR